MKDIYAVGGLTKEQRGTVLENRDRAICVYKPGDQIERRGRDCQNIPNDRDSLRQRRWIELCKGRDGGEQSDRDERGRGKGGGDSCERSLDDHSSQSGYNDAETKAVKR